MLIANTVTGAASLMRREVAEGALPFPEVPGEQYHDHWLGLVAMSLGEIAYVDRPLYDYVQHGGALLGHAAANAGVTGGGARGAELIERFSSQRIRRYFSDSRGAYFRGYVRLQVLATVLLARFGGRMALGRRRALRRFIRAERSPAGVRAARASFAAAHRPAATRPSASSGCSPAGSSGVTWWPSTAAVTCGRPAIRTTRACRPRSSVRSCPPTAIPRAPTSSA